METLEIAQTSITDISLERFFSGLNASIKSTQEVRKLYDKEIAFDFNALNFFWPAENKTSEILRFFLDPSESHAQGDVFLKSFLISIGLGEKHLGKHVVVECEHYTNEKRKIDIVIKLNDYDFVIGIENKIYHGTPDQYMQLSHYASYLAGKTNQNFLLLYLAPKGKNPPENSMPKTEQDSYQKVGLFKVINYEDLLIGVIVQWANDCQAQRVKSFLQDFAQFLKHKYLGENFMNERDLVIQHALKSHENINAALATGSAVAQLKTTLIDKLKEQLFDLGKDNFLVEDEDGWGKGAESYLAFELKKSKYRMSIYLGFEKMRNDFSVGVWVKDEKKAPQGSEIYNHLTKEITHNLNIALGERVKDHPNWLYLIYYKKDNMRNWDESRDIWTGISTGKTAKDLMKLVNIVYENIVVLA